MPPWAVTTYKWRVLKEVLEGEQGTYKMEIPSKLSIYLQGRAYMKWKFQVNYLLHFLILLPFQPLQKSVALHPTF